MIGIILWDGALWNEVMFCKIMLKQYGPLFFHSFFGRSHSLSRPYL